VHRLVAAASYDAPTERGSRENAFVTHLSWSYDRNHLLYCRERINGSGYRDIRLLKIKIADDLAVATEVPCNLDGGEDPCFSPDGHFIAYFGSYDGDYAWGILAQTTDGKRIIPLIKGGEQPVW
jgi:hypothetical protein